MMSSKHAAELIKGVYPFDSKFEACAKECVRSFCASTGRGNTDEWAAINRSARFCYQSFEQGK